MSGNNLPALLIVDDEPDVAELLESVLEDDFDCTVSTDPVAALELIASKSFDIVVTDLKMPGVSGAEVVAAAKQAAEAQNHTTKVYISSGHSSDDDYVKEALDKGADGLITKPYTDFAAIVAMLSS